MVYKALGNRVFAFLLDLSELNDNLGEHTFGDTEFIRPILEFSRLIYRDILNRPYLIQGDLTWEERKIR